MYNAKVLENVGAAIIIENDKLDGINLNSSIQKIVTDKSKMLSMQKGAISKATYDVENKIYNEIKKLKGE